jgi:hypothetical protein
MIMDRDGSSEANSAGPGPGVNKGIYMAGGTIGAAVVGKNAKVKRVKQVNYGTGASDPDPLEMIDRLLQKLETDAGALEGEQAEQAEDVVDEVHQLHTEMHRRRPNAESIRNTLSRLTAAAGSAATLLATVDQIKDLIGTLVH